MYSGKRVPTVLKVTEGKLLNRDRGLPPTAVHRLSHRLQKILSFLSLTKTNQSHLPVHKFSNIAKKLKTNLHFKSISKEIISAMVLSSI